MGTLASEPFLNLTSEALDLRAPITAYVPIGIAVLAGVVLLVLLAALGPAWRAGRLSAFVAITREKSPGRAGSGRLGTALAGLPLPAPARLGLGNMAARPLRAGMTPGSDHGRHRDRRVRPQPAGIAPGGGAPPDP